MEVVGGLGCRIYGIHRISLVERRAVEPALGLST